MSASSGALELPRGHAPRAWIALGAALFVAIAIFALATMDRSGGPATITQQSVTERLVNAGVIPSQTLQPALAAVEPLYSARDRALMGAVSAGVVPDEVLNTHDFLIKRLANQGLIPREAATS